MLLESEGLSKIDVFNDPELALSSFNSSAYGLALIDYKMPRMTGFELYEKLFAVQPSLKVLFISAYEFIGSDELLRKHPDLSTDSFLRKPRNPKLLLQVVEHKLACV